MEPDPLFLTDSLEAESQARFRRFARAFRSAVHQQSKNRFFNENFAGHDARRRIIYDLLNPLAQRFNFSQTTLFGAIGLLDAMISRFFFLEPRMRIMAVVCLGLSSKLYELHPMRFSELASLQFCPQELARVEKILLINLKFRVDVVTHFHLAAQILELLSAEIEPRLFGQLTQVVRSFSLAIASSYSINRYTPVSLALTVFQLVERLLGIRFAQLPCIFQLVGLEEEDTSDSYQSMTEILRHLMVRRETARMVKSNQEPNHTVVETSSFFSLDL